MFSFMLFILFFLFMNLYIHPIIIMLIILIYSCLICFKMSLWKSNYLYSIMLFLIMISGLLIIFLYFSSLISNEQINFKFNKTLMYSFFMNLLMMFMMLFYSNFLMSPLKFNFIENKSINMLNKKIFQNILSLYEYPLNNLTIMTMFYLLLSLFIIIKMCSMKSISLRKIN